MKTLGPYPALTLKEATSKALGFQKAVLDGEDIVAAPVASITVEALCTIAERDWWPELTHKTQTSFTNILKAHVRKKLGDLKVREVVFADIGRFRQTFLGIPSTGNHALSVLNLLFKKAIEWGYRDPGTNPVTGITYFPKRERERYLTPEEVAHIFQKLESSTAALEAKNALRMLFWTGARKGEIMDLTWDQVHLEDREIIIPPKKHKTGKKHGAKVIQLPPEAVDLLRGVRKWDRIPRVFPGAHGGPCWAIDRLWREVREGLDMGEDYLDRIVIHTIRHSVASFAISSGLTLKEVGGLLGHRDSSSTERYAKLMKKRSVEVAAVAAKAISDASRG